MLELSDDPKKSNFFSNLEGLTGSNKGYVVTNTKLHVKLNH